MTYKAKEHWGNIYHTKASDEVSWYQKKPKTSLALIAGTGLDKDSMIIDVGAGDSNLVDNLLNKGYKNITLLDVSSEALERAKTRLGNKADDVKWSVSDLREFETNDRYEIWHDRAVLHFLTAEEDIKKYVDSVKRFLKPCGYLIIAAFSLNGPRRCSGLKVTQYSEDSMKRLFNEFEHIKSFEEKHITPLGAEQIFLYSVFRKK